MKKFLMITVLLVAGFFAFAEDVDGRCDLREDNKHEWDAANMKIEYEMGASIQELMERWPEYTYDEIYFMVEG